MEIVLFILKTVGVIVLVILGLLLVLAALLLFVPVRYRAEGRMPEEGSPQAYIRFTWLLHLISFRVEYADGLKMTVRAAGIRIRPETWKRQKKASEGRKPAPGREGKEPVGGPESGCGEQDSAGGPLPGQMEEKAAGEPSPGRKEQEAAGKRESTGSMEPAREKDASEGGRKWTAALRNKLHGLLRTLENGGRAAERLFGKIERIRKTVSYYRSLLEEDWARAALRLIWKHLKGLFLHAKPKRLSADLTIGAEDPAVTGNVLAVQGILYPWIGEKIHIIPDFEQERLCGEFYAAGRIRACVVFYHILRVLLDKKTWMLIRRLKKEELTNG